MMYDNKTRKFSEAQEDINFANGSKFFCFCIRLAFLYYVGDDFLGDTHIHIHPRLFILDAHTRECSSLETVLEVQKRGLSTICNRRRMCFVRVSKYYVTYPVTSLPSHILFLRITLRKFRNKIKRREIKYYLALFFERSSLCADDLISYGFRNLSNLVINWKETRASFWGGQIRSSRIEKNVFDLNFGFEVDRFEWELLSHGNVALILVFGMQTCS